MPALPAVPSVLFVRAKITVGADLDVLTRFYFQYSGTAPTNAVCATIASTLFTYFADEFAVYMPTTSAVTGMYVQDLTSATAGAGEHTGSTAGTGDTQGLPASTAALFNLAIDRRYRGGKPRRYIALGGIGDLETPQTWVSASATNFLAAFNEFISDALAIDDSGTDLGVHVSVSYYDGFTAVTNPITGRTKDVPKLRTGGPVIDEVAGVSVNPRLGSQRRRNLLRS